MSTRDVLELVVVIVLLLVVIAWYLSYAAARLDRLHARVEGALAALDASLIRRAEATMEVATSGEFDLPTTVLLVDRATACLDYRPTAPAGDELVDPHFPERALAESHLSQALRASIPSETVADIESASPAAAMAVERLAQAAYRVQIARQMHNQAVSEVTRVRGKAVVRAARLAGRAPMPVPLEFDDSWPESLGR